MSLDPYVVAWVVCLGRRLRNFYQCLRLSVNHVVIGTHFPPHDLDQVVMFAVAPVKLSYLVNFALDGTLEGKLCLPFILQLHRVRLYKPPILRVQSQVLLLEELRLHVQFDNSLFKIDVFVIVYESLRTVVLSEHNVPVDGSILSLLMAIELFVDQLLAICVGFRLCILLSLLLIEDVFVHLCDRFQIISLLD